MPFSAPHFFRRRSTADSAVLEYKNKLKKRAPFCIDRNTASLDLTKGVMGNKFSSFDNGPRPSRPQRPLGNDLPNLPSQPIYKSFTATTHPPTILDDENKPPIPEKSPSRRSSICSRVWPPPIPGRGRSSDRVSTPSPRKLSSSVDTGVPEKGYRNPPRYDRASYLAESYRALLPDMGSDTRPHSSWDPREPRQQRDISHTLHHLGNRSLNDPVLRAPEAIRPWLSPPGPRPASAASSSSLTAVDRDDHSPAFSDAESVTPTCPARCRRWSLDSQYLQSISLSERPPRLHDGHSHVYTTAGPPPGRQRTSDDVGLQICSDMLNEELRKTLINRKSVSKLQMLLLIEAYETTLETCRKEVSRPPLTRGGGGEMVRKRHVREAVKILDHWLNSLYTLYDEEFGEEGDLDVDYSGTMV